MFYASKTKGKLDRINAEDVSAKDLQSSFYCPCETCGCKMGFKSFNSNERKNHFFKLPSSNHTSDCYVPYYKTSNDSRYQDFNTKNFSPDKLLNNVTLDNKKSHTNWNGNENLIKNQPNHLDPANHSIQIKTLRQLYNFCISHHPRTIINDELKISNVFVGCSTSYLYTVYISGIKLVECRFNNQYDEENYLLKFKYPLQKSENMLQITTIFEDQSLFYG